MYKKIILPVVLGMISFGCAGQELMPSNEVIMVNPRPLKVQVSSSENARYLVRLEPFHLNGEELVNEPTIYVFRWDEGYYVLVDRIATFIPFPKKIMIDNSGKVITLGEYQYGGKGDVVLVYGKGQKYWMYDGAVMREGQGKFMQQPQEIDWICWLLPIEIEENVLSVASVFGEKVYINLKSGEVKKEKDSNSCNNRN